MPFVPFVASLLSLVCVRSRAPLAPVSIGFVGKFLNTIANSSTTVSPVPLVVFPHRGLLLYSAPEAAQVRQGSAEKKWESILPWCPEKRHTSKEKRGSRF